MTADTFGHTVIKFILKATFPVGPLSSDFYRHLVAIIKKTFFFFLHDSPVYASEVFSKNIFFNLASFYQVSVELEWGTPGLNN